MKPRYDFFSFSGDIEEKDQAKEDMARQLAAIEEMRAQLMAKMKI
jgi:hypothetical protein